jgi:2,3-dihydroxybenzoate decarboxylase
MKKIALEEHFMSPGLEEYWRPTMSLVPPDVFKPIYERLTNFGDLRLGEMDGAGIQKAVLSIAGPGVQIEPDAKRATYKAAESNDFLAKEVEARPDRYDGFAHIALQDPKEAAAELERCVKMGFKGAMINGQTLGHYLDERQFDPFWAKAEELGVPVYLHPADPVRMSDSYGDYKVLMRATWGWGVETGTHALRIVFGGVFERFPKALLMLGHLGESLPFMLWRLDSRAKTLYGVKMKKDVSQYIIDNIAVTISGMYSPEPVECSIAALGKTRVMFSADFPFESIHEAGHFMDSVKMDEELRADIAWRNAAKLLKIDMK